MITPQNTIAGETHTEVPKHGDITTPHTTPVDTAVQLPKEVGLPADVDKRFDDSFDGLIGFPIIDRQTLNAFKKHMAQELSTLETTHRAEVEEIALDDWEIVTIVTEWDGTKAECEFYSDLTWMGGYSTEDILEEDLMGKKPGLYKVRYLCTYFTGQEGEEGRWEISPGFEVNKAKIQYLESLTTTTSERQR